MNDIQNAGQYGRLPGPLTWIVLVAWFGAILLLSDLGYLRRPAGGPPIPLLAVIIGPQIGFWLGYMFLSGFRKYVHTLDIAFLTSVQSWRVVGLVLVFLWAYGLLPGGFAIPAGLGDLFVGVVAVFVTLHVVRRSRGWRGSVVFLSVIGIVDFVFAVWAANFAGSTSFDPQPADAAMTAGILTRLPMSMIPGFLVPAFACAHYAALLRVFER